MRACFGIAEVVRAASFYKIIGDHFDARERSRATALVFTAFSMAPAFAGPFVALLIGAYGWRAMFVVMMAPALLAATINWRVIPAHHSTASVPIGPSASDQSFGRVLRRPSLWLLSLGMLAMNIPYWGYFGWMPSYLALDRHIDLKSVGPIGSIPYIFAVGGTLIGGWLGSGPLHR